MNEETKAAADAALVESMVQQLRDCVSVGDEMTLDHASLIDDAAGWIAGEPARLAAARERAETAEAALAEAHERLDEFGMRRDGTTATPVEGIAAMRTRIDEYRAEWYRAEAQVAAARAVCERLIDRPWSRWAGDAGRDVLRAMDEATKK